MAVSCEAKCGKSILISFTLIYWLAGGTLLILGTWIFLEPAKIYLFHVVTSAQINRDFGFQIAYGLLTLGGIVFLVGWFGCCGAIRENRCLLVTYCILLLILLSVEIGMSAVTLIYREHFLKDLDQRLTDQLIHHYGHRSTNTNISFSEAMDFAQYKFHCCGIHGHTDYSSSRWLNESRISIEPRSVPATCCVPQAEGENFISNAGSPISVVTRVFHGTVEEPWQKPYLKDDIACQDSDPEKYLQFRHLKGCINNIEEWFRKETTMVITVSICSALLQLLGMILSTCLCRNLQSDI